MASKREAQLAAFRPMRLPRTGPGPWIEAAAPEPPPPLGPRTPSETFELVLKALTQPAVEAAKGVGADPDLGRGVQALLDQLNPLPDAPVMAGAITGGSKALRATYAKALANLRRLTGEPGSMWKPLRRRLLGELSRTKGGGLSIKGMEVLAQAAPRRAAPKRLSSGSRTLSELGADLERLGALPAVEDVNAARVALALDDLLRRGAHSTASIPVRLPRANVLVRTKGVGRDPVIAAQHARLETPEAARPVPGLERTGPKTGYLHVKPATESLMSMIGGGPMPEHPVPALGISMIQAPQSGQAQRLLQAYEALGQAAGAPALRAQDVLLDPGRASVLSGLEKGYLAPMIPPAPGWARRMWPTPGPETPLPPHISTGSPGGMEALAEFLIEALKGK